MQLRQVLDEIAASGVSTADKRGLWRFAVGVAAGGPQAVARVSCDDTITRLEEILVAAGSGKKTSITNAKERLRALGPEGAGLASRLSRLSKSRNSRAHPDTGLLEEVKRIIDRSDSDTSFQDQEADHGGQENIDVPSPPIASYNNYEDKEKAILNELAELVAPAAAAGPAGDGSPSAARVSKEESTQTEPSSTASETVGTQTDNDAEAQKLKKVTYCLRNTNQDLAEIEDLLSKLSEFLDCNGGAVDRVARTTSWKAVNFNCKEMSEANRSARAELEEAKETLYAISCRTKSI